jgi:16S rRNA (adenine1518-N6/adenine1519-N6)-dimethyltransferase
MKSQFSKVRPWMSNTLMGQHFLTSSALAERIVDAAQITSKDIILEVGPGKGILAEILARRAKKVIAIEKDERFVELLKQKFSRAKNIEIISGDILKIDLDAILPKKYKIVANIPYYLTSHFLRIFLEGEPRPQSMTLMIQYEVARRVVAQPPNMNLLALSVQAYGKPKIIQKVPRSFFHPQPNVDSALITITEISDSFFTKNKIEPKKFFEIARKAFQKKRKTLHNSIGIDSQKRPQELSLDAWTNVMRN